MFSQIFYQIHTGTYICDACDNCNICGVTLALLLQNTLRSLLIFHLMRYINLYKFFCPTIKYIQFSGICLPSVVLFSTTFKVPSVVPKFHQFSLSCFSTSIFLIISLSFDNDHERQQQPQNKD